MEASGTSETLVTTHTSEDENPVLCCENFISHIPLNIILLTCYPKFSWYSSALPGK
jgi:hypothetical protein